jgi:hexokinase
MNVTWVMDWPTGKEEGLYLALDLGGTNLRVAEIKLDGKRSFDITQSKYRLPEDMKTSSSEALWEYIADCLEKFIAFHHPDTPAQSLPVIHLGFTFSYPCTQDAINKGVLQRWTKGFDIDGVEGKDVCPMLMGAIKKRNLPVQLSALINDTTGTLVASHYVNPRTRVGCIFGTGCNAAYYDTVGNIPKILDRLPADIHANTSMAINCEYGAFDNEHVALPRTSYDVVIDENSPRPNQQAFEKMIAGYYLGEILRLVLVDLHDQGFVFERKDITKLRKEYLLDTSFLSKIEEDPFENLNDVEMLFLEELGLETTEPERKLIRRLAELIGTRAARLSACGVAAIAKKTGWTSFDAAADGSVFNKYPNFKERGAQALKEIFDWDYPDPKDYPIKIVPAEDGSGVGAALIAALSAQRIAAGKSVGF